MRRADTSAPANKRPPKPAAAIDRDYVLRRLVEEAELSGEGASHAARIAALALLGKHLGMFTEKVEFTGQVTFVIEK